MAVDYQNVSFSALGAASFNVQQFEVSLEVRDSTTNALLFNLTGANRVRFPQDLAGLTAAQRRTIVRRIIEYLIKLRIGEDIGEE